MDFVRGAEFKVSGGTILEQRLRPKARTKPMEIKTNTRPMEFKEIWRSASTQDRHLEIPFFASEGRKPQNLENWPNEFYSL